MNKRASEWPHGSNNLGSVALEHLDSIAAYISKDSPAAARRLVERVFHRVERLAMFL